MIKVPIERDKSPNRIPVINAVSGFLKSLNNKNNKNNIYDRPHLFLSIKIKIFFHCEVDNFFAFDIIQTGKNVRMLHWSSENPRVAALGFSFPFWRGGSVLRLIAGSVPVEPFADVVGDYTSRNRD